VFCAAGGAASQIPASTSIPVSTGGEKLNKLGIDEESPGVEHFILFLSLVFVIFVAAPRTSVNNAVLEGI
jgi:hypothetical protein